MKTGDFGALPALRVRWPLRRSSEGPSIPGPRLVGRDSGNSGDLLSVVTWKDRLGGEEWLVLGLIAGGPCSAVVVREHAAGGARGRDWWLVAWCFGCSRVGRRSVLQPIGAAIRGCRGRACWSWESCWRSIGPREHPGWRPPREPQCCRRPGGSGPAPGLSFQASAGGRGGEWSSLFPLVAGVVLTGSRAGLLALLAASPQWPCRGARPVPRGWHLGSLCAAGVLTWRFVSQPDVLAWFRPAIWGAVLSCGPHILSVVSDRVVCWMPRARCGFCTMIMSASGSF